MAENKTNKQIKLVEDFEEDKARDFKAELATLIGNNNTAKKTDTKMLEALTERALKLTDELAELRNSYLRLHNLTDGKDEFPYDINLVQLGITYSIHECHKVISYLQDELKRNQ